MSCNILAVPSPHCSKPLTCPSVEITELIHHRKYFRLPSPKQILKILIDIIYCTKDIDSTQSNRKYVHMICTKKSRQLICTYQCYKGLFEDIYNQHWITTVFQISNIIYYTSVSLSTEEIQFEICQYIFRFQSRLSTYKQRTNTQYQTKKNMHLDNHIIFDSLSARRYQTDHILLFYHTYFLYSIISPSNFQLCTNLSRSYSRNPRPPANHSAIAENFTHH